MLSSPELSISFKISRTIEIFWPFCFCLSFIFFIIHPHISSCPSSIRCSTYRTSISVLPISSEMSWRVCIRHSLFPRLKLKGVRSRNLWWIAGKEKRVSIFRSVGLSFTIYFAFCVTSLGRKESMAMTQFAESK